MKLITDEQIDTQDTPLWIIVKFIDAYQNRAKSIEQYKSHVPYVENIVKKIDYRITQYPIDNIPLEEYDTIEVDKILLENYDKIDLNEMKQVVDKYLKIICKPLDIEI